MYRSTRLIALIASALFVTSAVEAESAHIGIKELARSAIQFIGKPVSTHGCLVNSFHGSFVRLCGSNDWHELVLILDPSYRVPAAFRRLSIDYSHDLEGDFSGVIVEKAVDWPRPKKQLFLRLDSVVNAVPYEP